ncbi:MAG: hypothetical protein HDR24_02810 [Lachnospiraceae bacterium]|nr:hypothetical protein [Lachnospiraceae bacterium]
MSTLFIIGNGFDRAHGLKTSYWDFRNYLEKYAEEFLVQLENMYNIAPFERLDKRFKKNRCIQNRRDDAIYEALWKDFEYGLGEVNEAEMLDYSETIVNDLVLDSGPVAIKDTLDVYWTEQYGFITQLNEYVTKWIKQVRLYKATPIKFTFIDNSEDYFFTFNYTSVLERIYRIPSNHILHIHGGLCPYCDESPVLGHGNEKKIKEYRKKADGASEEYDEGRESIFSAIADYYERTLKNTSKCIVFQNAFFRQLMNVDNVDIIGHSFGKVDIPYFAYLKRCISKDAHWRFYYYSSEDQNAAKKAVEELKIDNRNYKILHSDYFWR